jgi:hypothetical protein
MVILVWIYVYGLLTLSLSVDAGLVMLSNLTHTRSKGVIHINHTNEGEVW